VKKNEKETCSRAEGLKQRIIVCLMSHNRLIPFVWFVAFFHSILKLLFWQVAPGGTVT